MMEDTSNIKTNFLGKDGFRWWIGQVPPAPNHKVNWNVNKNWGLKRRVRIMGYHPDEKKLPDKDLPLAFLGTLGVLKFSVLRNLIRSALF